MNAVNGTKLPQAEDAEKGLISCLLMAPVRVLDECILHQITERHFHNPARAEIFTAIKDMQRQCRPIDVVTFPLFLGDNGLLEEVGGGGAIAELFTFVPTASNAAYYIEILKEKAAARNAIAVADRIKEVASDPAAGNIDAVVYEALESIRLSTKQGRLCKLSTRKPSEILAMEFSADDFLLDNGYLAKGDATAFCGAGGVGKSRLVMQLVIALVTGRDFLGWKTRGKGTRWLILQTENGNRRLRSELVAMLSDLTDEEKQAVDEGITIHTLEKSEDSFLTLRIPENEARVANLIREIAPTGVIFDVLRDFGISDLNTDEGMTETLSSMARLTRHGDPQRIPLIIHHALTGKSGAARATGFDRGSFGRNSKVLFGWARSQINIATHDPDTNETLIIASGKSNNAEEFKPFAVRLDSDTMTYHRDDSIDIEEWKERVGADATASAAKITIAGVVKVVAKAGLDGIEKVKIAAALKEETAVSTATAYRWIDRAEAKKAIIRRKDDELYVAPNHR